MEYNKEYYKAYQILDVLVCKYGFNEIILKKYQDFFQSESWMTNYNDKHYQVIRVTFSDNNLFDNEVLRINEYLEYFKKQSGKKIKFLDIHINKNKYDKSLEDYDYLNIEEDFYDGVDIRNIYKGIDEKCIHTVADPKKETEALTKKIQKSFRKRISLIKILKATPIKFTLGISVFCCLMFVLSFGLSLKYDKISVFLLLGADYKTLTLCCNEFYRLITYAFLHSDVIHLSFNVLSLMSLGRIVEYRLGQWKFLLILFVSILCGSLTQGILADNELCIGMSGGLYGLFVAFAIDMYKTKVVDLRSLIPAVITNILLNFLSTTAWMCHLGGAIGGLAAYFAISKKKNYGGYALVAVLIICLAYKYLSIDTITTFYGGTDTAYVNLLDSLNINSSKIISKLMNAYTKYGG